MSTEQRKQVYYKVVQPGDGWAGIVKKGQYLRIVDIEGEQVADLVFLTPTIPKSVCLRVSQGRANSLVTLELHTNLCIE